MLPSPQGAAQNEGRQEEPGGAQHALPHCTQEQDASGESPSQDTSSPSAHSKGFSSPENEKLKVKKDRKALREKKNMQLQSLKADKNNKIVPPQLNPEQQRVLGNNFVDVLKQKSPKHPTAVFQCVICKKFCESYDMVHDHVNEPVHKLKLQRVVDDMTLKCLPPPTPQQIDCVTGVINGVVTANSLVKKMMKDRRAVAERLNTLAEKIQPDCGVRIYGSSLTGLALRTSDLNLELTMNDESMASKMLCQLADEIEKDNEVYRNVERNFTDSEPAIMFFIKEYTFKCVIIMQNKHSYKLSKLIADYVGIDHRVKQLGIMLRKMAADLGLDKPDVGFWPPHAFALLMIYFLQQLKDPVLPVLHELADNLEYKPEVYYRKKSLAKKWHTANKMSVGELWLKFLRFYTVEFLAHDHIVCIRQHELLTRASKNWTGKKIAIEDPFLPKVNVSRSLESVACFEFVMNCLKRAYKYFGVLQLPSDPILSWIYDSSTFNCTFQPQIMTHKNLKQYTKWVSIFNDRPPQNVNFVGPDKPVLKEDAGFLFEILNPRYLYYKYEPAKFIGKEGRPIMCTACGNMGHSSKKCKVEKLLPFPENLPPMEDYYLDAITKCCAEIEEVWSMQPDEVEKRKQIVSDLEKFVRLKKPEAKLELFGSSCNGFGLQKSDIDVCMTFRNNASGEGIEFVKEMEALTLLLKGYNKTKNILAITTAKVPITKFYLPEYDLEGDISLYNVLALRNTRLLNTYAAIDPRVKTLGCMVKRFAKACDICDAPRGSLSSYAYVLMLIFFLQRCNPPVLPVLQELCRPHFSQLLMDDFDAHWIGDFDTYFYSDISQLSSVWDHYGENKASVSELWLEFLKFYSKFNFREHVISIRHLKPLLCFDKRWTDKVMSIEDPFEFTHNLGARLSRKMLVYVINTFRTAYTLFATPRISCLDYFGRLEKYFLDPHQLTSGEPPNDRGCRLCKKADHMIRQCPQRKQSRTKNMQQKRGNGPGMDRRQAPRNEPLLARNVIPQARIPPRMYTGFPVHQPVVVPSKGSYKQLLVNNRDLTRNAQNLRFNKFPPAFTAKSNNTGQKRASSNWGAPLPAHNFNANINRAPASNSALGVNFDFAADGDSSVLPRRTADLTASIHQHTVGNVIHPFRFQLNNGVSMPGPSSVTQNSVFSFSSENKLPGASPRLFNGMTSPLKQTVFEGPPPRPSTNCFYGPPQTPPVVDVRGFYEQKK